MSERTDDIHHVTAVSGDAQEAVESYAAALGFTRDVPVADLGSSLALPARLGEDREFLEERLPPVEVDGARAPTEAD